MAGTVVKSKVDELGEEVREGFLRRLRKDLTDVAQGVCGKKRFWVSFQYVCKKYLTSNQLNVMIVEKIPVEEEPKVLTIPVIPDDAVT